MTITTPDPTLSAIETAIPTAPHYLAIDDPIHECWTVRYGTDHRSAYICGMLIGPDGERFAKEIANFLNQLERSPAWREINRLRTAILGLGMMAAGAAGGDEEGRRATRDSGCGA